MVIDAVCDYKVSAASNALYSPPCSDVACASNPNTQACRTVVIDHCKTAATVADILQNGDVRYQPPPGCYFKGNGDANEKLFFLPSDSTGSCSSGEACLCWVGEVCSNTEGASVNCDKYK